MVQLVCMVSFIYMPYSHAKPKNHGKNLSNSSWVLASFPVYCWRVRWWRTDREYSSPVWRVTKESCGTPHRVRLTNLDIILNIKRWKLRIESSTVAPIQKKKLIAVIIHFHNTHQTPTEYILTLCHWRVGSHQGWVN